MNDSATLVAQLEHAALIGGFERTLLRDAAARIAELEAEREHAVYAYVSARIAELEAQVTALTASAEEARAALRPPPLSGGLT